ncbi:hypothetical protein LCGC14_1984140 [marine sediment metagenome]|uniref:Uncharacterized protein n=1 Tax=marine sediment metagenome TaxID=412755 RepID=A0A0F9F7Y2_9ZZZZ
MGSPRKWIDGLLVVVFLVTIPTLVLANKWKGIVEANDYKNYQTKPTPTFKVTVRFPYVLPKVLKKLKPGQDIMGVTFEGAVIGKLIRFRVAGLSEVMVWAELYSDVPWEDGKVLWDKIPLHLFQKVSFVTPDMCCILEDGEIVEISKFPEEEVKTKYVMFRDTKPSILQALQKLPEYKRASATLYFERVKPNELKLLKPGAIIRDVQKKKDIGIIKSIDWARVHLEENDDEAPFAVLGYRVQIKARLRGENKHQLSMKWPIEETPRVGKNVLVEVGGRIFQTYDHSTIMELSYD